MAIGDHLTTFQVKNFKGFDDLEVKNLGWVNLIVGDNNVGKTSLLEALHFHADARSGVDAFRERLITILQEVRGVTNLRSFFLDVFVNRAKAQLPEGVDMFFRMTHKVRAEAVYSLTYAGGKIGKQQFINDGKAVKSVIRNNNGPVSTVALPYIPVNRGYGPDLVSNYSIHIQQNVSLRHQLLEDLRILIPELKSFEPSEIMQPSTIILFLKDTESSIPLPLMGEGTIKLFRILSEILVWKGQRLMIDEIDTGFHHSRMRPFWKTILTAARRHETQLFVTTHNLECIQHLKHTLQEDMPEFQDEVRVLRLARVQSGVKAYTYTYPEFESAIDNENELR
ncbi:MAG: AAA family ATPase [Bacteroidia bacterium]|nr:AAA family ATPase [Bacteroidia bacterium]